MLETVVNRVVFGMTAFVSRTLILCERLWRSAKILVLYADGFSADAQTVGINPSRNETFTYLFI